MVEAVGTDTLKSAEDSSTGGTTPDAAIVQNHQVGESNTPVSLSQVNPTQPTPDSTVPPPQQGDTPVQGGTPVQGETPVPGETPTSEESPKESPKEQETPPKSKEKKKGILKKMRIRTYPNKHVDFDTDIKFIPFNEEKDRTIEIQIVKEIRQVVSYKALFQAMKEEENKKKEMEAAEEKKRLEEEKKLKKKEWLKKMGQNNNKNSPTKPNFVIKGKEASNTSQTAEVGENHMAPPENNKEGTVISEVNTTEVPQTIENNMELHQSKNGEETTKESDSSEVNTTIPQITEAVKNNMELHQDNTSEETNNNEVNTTKQEQYDKESQEVILNQKLNSTDTTLENSFEDKTNDPPIFSATPESLLINSV